VVPEPTAGSEQGGRVKAVVIVADGDYGLLVMPMEQRVDWRHLARRLGAGRVRPASRSEIERLFPDCDADAVPAAGLLYDVPLYLSRALSERQEIVFPVGRRGSAAKTSLGTFERLAQPYWLDTAGEPDGER